MVNFMPARVNQLPDYLLQSRIIMSTYPFFKTSERHNADVILRNNESQPNESNAFSISLVLIHSQN